MYLFRLAFGLMTSEFLVAAA